MIEIHPMGYCRTITFFNLTFKDSDPTVWVCEDAEAFDRCLRELQGMGHIKIIQQGPSVVKTAA